MKVIALGGVPACGKSTLVKNLIEDLDLGEKERLAFGTFGHRVQTPDLLIIGDYSAEAGDFPGTDRLSMAAHQPVLELLQTKPASVVLFEGDRLFSADFLAELQSIEGAQLKIVMIEASGPTLKARHTQRGDTQSGVFLKGRKTKVLSVVNDPRLRSRVVCLQNNTPEEAARALAMLRVWVGISGARVPRQ